MKIIKTASGKKITLSKKEWQDIGKTAGWWKNLLDDGESQDRLYNEYAEQMQNPPGPESHLTHICKNCEKKCTFEDSKTGCPSCGSRDVRGTWEKDRSTQIKESLQGFTDPVCKMCNSPISEENYAVKDTKFTFICNQCYKR